MHIYNKNKKCVSLVVLKYKIISSTYTNIMNSSSVFFKFKEQMYNNPLGVIPIHFSTRASQTFPPHKN